MVGREGESTVWTIHGERVVDDTRRLKPRGVARLLGVQPSVGTTDAENLLFVAVGAERIGVPVDVNEAERVEWIELASVRERIAGGEIVGAASIAGLLHVLAFPR